MRQVNRGAIIAGAVVLAAALLASGSRAPDRPLEVAVAVADVEAIVRAVGGGDVRTFALFRGCLLRPDLEVDGPAAQRLGSADAVVWSGLFNESAAVHHWLEGLSEERRGALVRPSWIDVSRDAVRVNVPASKCDGYLDLQFMPGDPFFWLNPDNGAVIARNVAAGLKRLRPVRAAFYDANAAAFIVDLEARTTRWRAELAPLASLRVFAAQCGWQNLSRLGGPRFITCRNHPGSLEPPAVLAAKTRELGVDAVILDPNTPAGYREAFEAEGARVVVIPSSIGDLPGASTYPALFDNLVDRLREVARSARPGEGA